MTDLLGDLTLFGTARSAAIISIFNPVFPFRAHLSSRLLPKRDLASGRLCRMDGVLHQAGAVTRPPTR
jgi:hypothetical protein